MMKSIKKPENVLSPEKKAVLIWSIFKGREDVVAKWYKSKAGKQGYSPICGNEWKAGLCKKKDGGNCSNCENPAYTPMSDELIMDHLSGKRIFGVYPLLTDNTCWFVAADFDKHKPSDPDPEEEVKKFVAVCEVHGFSPCVFRSKSGKGFHVYLFFQAPVPAGKSRVVVHAMLQEAEVIGEDVKISSFDRLFPNQDMHTGKGLGNLIALPFQGKAIANGHTLLLDPGTDYKKPHADQFEELSRIKKSTEEDLDDLIAEWDLKKEEPVQKQPKEVSSGLPVLGEIEKRCAFMKHFRDDAETLSELEWYMGLTMVVRCENGDILAHDRSKEYGSYTFQETEAKIQHAKKDTGPYKCNTIGKKTSSKFCKNCKHRKQITSPIQLGVNPRAYDVAVDTVAELNEEHAIIRIGGKTLVINEYIDTLNNQPDFSLSSITDFRLFYENKRVQDPDNPKKEISKAELWLKSINRREYPRGIVFDPSTEGHQNGCYNLWHGLAFEPKKGDWSLFRNHIEETIADGVKAISDYILAWMARIIQDPGGERPGTSLALRGKQGSGKGVLVNQFGKILGKHFIQIAQANQVTGRFNDHLKAALLVFVDEGFWAGDKQAEGVLKNMITEPYLTIEPKNKDIFRVQNHVNMVLSSNNSWVIPAGMEERRFMVIDVSDKHLQDHKYFKAINDQMENGGLEAMLYDLMYMDISGVELRTFVQTAGLFEQKLHSMTTVQKYWFERLSEGNLLSAQTYDPASNITDIFPKQPDWSCGCKVKASDQYDDYLAFAKQINDRHSLCDAQFGLELKKLCKTISKIRSRENGVRYIYRGFPSLDDCRSEFCCLIKTEIEWDDALDLKSHIQKKAA